MVTFHQFFSEFDGRQSVRAIIHRHMHLTVQFTVCLRHASSTCSARLVRTYLGMSAPSQGTMALNTPAHKLGNRFYWHCFLFDSICQGLSNHRHFSRPTAEVRRKHSLAQAGPVRLGYSLASSAQHDLGPWLRRHWPTPPLPTFWPFWPSSCPNRRQEHLIIRGGATSCCCCSNG